MVVEIIRTVSDIISWPTVLENHVSLLSGGAVVAVINAMHTHANNAEVQYLACAALMNLATDPGMRRTVLCLAQHVFICIVYFVFFCFCLVVGFLSALSDVLFVIVLFVADCRDGIARNGGIQVVVGTMLKFQENMNLQMYGSGALRSLLRDHQGVRLLVFLF